MDENVRQLIDTAIEREQAAYEFYMDIYNRISEPGVKDTMFSRGGDFCVFCVRILSPGDR